MSSYQPRRIAESLTLPVRGLRYHVWRWGDPALATPARPAVFLLHGWMDVGASFQFMVDALAGDRCLYAPDWRGFGLTQPGGHDTYWFPDYLGDLEVLLDGLVPGQPVDLVAHSMGGNVAMLYAGIRPTRVRRLANLEGFGLPEQPVAATPRQFARWLDALQSPARLKPYATLADVAERMRRNNPRLTPERAAWLAPHWAEQREADGLWHLRSDPVHKQPGAVRYRADEVLACWARITAPLLWVEGRQTDIPRQWDQAGRMGQAGQGNARAMIEGRIATLTHVERAWLDDCGHMLQHDQPAALATLVERFLDQS
jgi:pimeloyl-ACP methyl ester carboxylesterase